MNDDTKTTTPREHITGFPRPGLYNKGRERLRKHWHMCRRDFKRYEPERADPLIRLDNRKRFAKDRLLDLLFADYKRRPID